MFNSTLLNHIDALKARLDRLRPLPPELFDNLREVSVDLKVLPIAME